MKDEMRAGRRNVTPNLAPPEVRIMRDQTDIPQQFTTEQKKMVNVVVLSEESRGRNFAVDVQAGGTFLVGTGGFAGPSSAWRLSLPVSPPRDASSITVRVGSMQVSNGRISVSEPSDTLQQSISTQLGLGEVGERELLVGGVGLVAGLGASTLLDIGDGDVAGAMTPGQ